MSDAATATYRKQYLVNATHFAAEQTWGTARMKAMFGNQNVRVIHSTVAPEILYFSLKMEKKWFTTDSRHDADT